jgi:hypothetical protein
MTSYVTIYSLIDANLLIKLTTGNGWGVNDINWILNEVKKMKDELCRVSIKNRNMKASFASVKLL